MAVDYGTPAAIDAPTTNPIIAGFAQTIDLATAQWSDTATGDLTDSDITNTSHPAANAVDACPGFKTQVNAATTATSFCLDFSDSPIDFDCVGFVNSNLTDATTVAVQVADNETFSTDLVTVNTFSSIGSGRFCEFLALRYSNVGYVRVVIQGASFLPYFGQIILAKRVQLATTPLMGYDVFRRMASRNVFESQGGVRFVTTNYSGQRVLEATWGVDQSADITNLENWYSDDVANGSKKFIWWNDASTYENQFNIMTFPDDDIDFEFPHIGPRERQFKLVAVEQGLPFLANE